MSLRTELADACHNVHKMGFVAAYDGNLSVRVSETIILITPSSVPKGEITPDDLLEIDYRGKLLKGNGRVSTEVKMHLLAYNSRPDVNSVIHCHPVYSTAFAARGEGFTEAVFPEVLLTLGKIPVCRYGTPSTEELTDSIKEHIDYANALLLENHGAVTLGSSIRDAFYKMEKLEHTANTLFVARLMGGANILSDENVRKLFAVSGKHKQ